VENKLSLIIPEQLTAVVIPSNYMMIFLTRYEIQNHSYGGKDSSKPNWGQLYLLNYLFC